MAMNPVDHADRVRAGFDFCERDAHLLLHRLSQQEIAKYIGITPVALSRIRKRLGLINPDLFQN